MFDTEVLFSDVFKKLKGNIIRELYKWTTQPGFISFAGGNPDPITFPAEQLAEIAHRILLENGTFALQYGVSSGALPLREFVADLMTREGVPSKVENISISAKILLCGFDFCEIFACTLACLHRIEIAVGAMFFAFELDIIGVSV